MVCQFVMRFGIEGFLRLVVGRDLTYSFWIGSSGSLPAAAMQAKMAMMTRRMARYFIFFGLVRFGLACFRRGVGLSSSLVRVILSERGVRGVYGWGPRFCTLFRLTTIPRCFL
jgi:hypothetical protein